MNFIVLLALTPLFSYSNAAVQFPARPRFVLEELGGKATFDCSTNDPSIRSSLWFKRVGKWVELAPRPGKVTVDSGVYTLMKLTVRDAGIYQCRAENENGDPIRWKPNESMLFLTAMRYPSVKITPNHVVYRKPGQDVKYICKASIASADLKWYKTIEKGYNNPIGERPIPQDENHVIKDVQTKQLHYVGLEIKNLGQADEGLYICRINYRGRKDYKYARVELQEK